MKNDTVFESTRMKRIDMLPTYPDASLEHNQDETEGMELSTNKTKKYQ